LAATAVLAIGLTACDVASTSGGSPSGGGTPTNPVVINNVQNVIVDTGPTVNGRPAGYVNALYTTVTLCVPGTTTCQSIDHVLVDTGSTGLRILSSQVTLSLPYVADANNNLVGNCVQYADSTYQWGPVVKVDLRMGDEVASSLPVQVVGPSNFAAAPAACSAGGSPVQTAALLGANGILGVGLFRQDCGAACATLSTAPAVYFTCPAAGCTTTAVALSGQLQNPVWTFPQDNNGFAIVLPQVGAGGALSVSGSMIFGIGTQTNNGLNSAQAQAADDVGNFTTTFNGVAYSRSSIDSGSNGYFFLDAKTVGLADCGASSSAPGFYCPTSPASFSAINTGPNPRSSNVTVAANIAFTIANAVTLFNSPETAFNNVGGPSPGLFDWGLPFFYGRTVFIGIEGQTSPAGTGPYWAY
jgi:hypothetical protein